MASDYDYADTPTLHYDVLNSQARSCCMLVKLLKIDMDFQQTDTLDITNYNDIYSWINSFCTLPVLVDGKITLCSGHSILIYLCKKYAPSNLQTLCPIDYASRIKLTSMLFYEGFILQRCLTHLLTDIFLANYPNFDEDYHKKKVFSIYTSLNSYLSKQNFLIGSRLTIADISAVATVSAFNIIFPIDYDKFPKLFDWLQGLRKMQFYNCNEEGIYKLRSFLKNACQFPFPSPFCYKPSGCTETPRNSCMLFEQPKKDNDFVNRKTANNCVCTEQLSNASKNQINQSVNDPELNKFIDTYLLNVEKCKCCSNIVVKSKSNLDQNENQKYNDIAKCLQIPDYSDMPKKFGNKRDSEETQEIYRRQNSCGCTGSSVETFGILERPSTNDINTDTSYCRCYNKLCEIDMGINRSKKLTKILSPSSDTSLETMDYAPCKRMNKIRRGDDCETNIRDTKLTQTDCATVPKEYLFLTNAKIQCLMDKVRKYEKILEMSDKTLIGNKEKLATIPSDISTGDPILNQPRKFSEQPDETSYRKSDSAGSEEGSFVESGSGTETENETETGVETLQETETPLTETTLTETSLTEVTETGSESGTESKTEASSSTESKKTKRLKGGFSPEPEKRQEHFLMSFDKFKKIDKDFAEKISHIGVKNDQIICVLYSKRNCTELNNYCCNDCYKKLKAIKSKIPRLVSNKSLANNKNCKTSKLLTRETGCGVSTQTN